MNWIKVKKRDSMEELEIIDQYHNELYSGVDYLPKSKKRIMEGDLITGAAMFKVYSVVGKYGYRVVHCKLRTVKRRLEFKHPKGGIE